MLTMLLLSRQALARWRSASNAGSAHRQVEGRVGGGSPAIVSLAGLFSSHVQGETGGDMVRKKAPGNDGGYKLLGSAIGRGLKGGGLGREVRRSSR